MNDWYKINDVGELDTPALVVYPDRVKHNIQIAIHMVGDVNRLRPHIKTNKSAGAIQLMQDAGITKFKCATIAEAELLGIAKAKDVVLAYQPQGPKLHRFVELVRKYPDTFYACLTDHIAIAAQQGKAFAEAGLTIPVYIDLNIGMNRTGILPGPRALELYRFVATTKGLRSAGLHAYDGHQRHANIEERTRQCNEGFKAVEEMAESLKKEGMSVPVIIAGGSPGFPIHAKREKVECSPGTFIYWDKGYSDLCAEQDFLPAAVLVTRIVSLPTPVMIATDLGHKSVAAENDISRRIHFLNAENVKPVSQSEEHLVVEADETHTHQPGDIWYGIPYHICPTVALYERVYTIENGKIRGEWKNAARDRKISL